MSESSSLRERYDVIALRVAVDTSASIPEFGFRNSLFEVRNSFLALRNSWLRLSKSLANF